MNTRNQRYVARMHEKGFIQINIWVPEQSAPDFKQAAAICCDYPNLTVSQLRDVTTGRFQSIHKAPVTSDFEVKP